MDSYKKWQQSDHQHAMDVATAQSVLGNFKDATFGYNGVQSKFFTRDGKFYVNTDNAKGAVETFQISYTFGHYPLQQYLISFPDGRLQALSIAWDSRSVAQGGQRWFHLYPNEKVTHENPLHWTGAFQNWNSRCASCHSTNLVKSYSQETDRYDTHWKEINVGCEACHGPGSNHAAWADKRGSSDNLDNKGLVTRIRKIWEPVDGKRTSQPPADFKLSGQIQVCSSCHSLRSELQQPVASASYFDNYRLSPLLEGRYYADGQIQAEVYETGSFLQSRMHHNQVSCTNCHDAHSGRIRLEGNALCLQCHDT
ncbi:MAG TPA: multiheme c-type cytochrome, partial [Terriglobia bacterium]|nr:multiheme c-type cytochrome [Terriglobia bacterium]